MQKTARAMVTALLGLTAVLLPAVGLAADTGLTLTADTATLGPAGSASCWLAPTPVGRSPPAIPTEA
jgi:hypothetical protein